MICVWKVSGSNLRHGSPPLFFHSSTQSLHRYIGVIPQRMLWSRPHNNDEKHGTVYKS